MFIFRLSNLVYGLGFPEGSRSGSRSSPPDNLVYSPSLRLGPARTVSPQGSFPTLAHRARPGTSPH